MKYFNGMEWGPTGTQRPFSMESSLITPNLIQLKICTTLSSINLKYSLQVVKYTITDTFSIKFVKHPKQLVLDNRD